MMPDYIETLSAITAELRRVSAILSTEELQSFSKRFQMVFDQVHFLVIQHADGASSAAASEHPLALQASKGMHRLLAALRAFDGQGEFVFVVHPDECTGKARDESQTG